MFSLLPNLIPRRFPFSFALLFALSLGLSSCQPVSNRIQMALEPVVDHQPIANALAIPKQTKAPSFTLKGSVQQVAPFIKGSAYQLNDDSGSIWIRSSYNDFAVGDRVILTGLPRYQSVKVSNQELGEVYVEEEKRIYKR